MATPSVPPYGELIEELRESAGVSMQRAADSAEVSKQTWNDIVKGHTQRPRAGTIARMARAVGLSPDRLEKAGGHPRAADVLREILNSTPSPAPLRPLPSLPAVSPDAPPEEYLRYLVERYGGDPLVRFLGSEENDGSVLERIADIIGWVTLRQEQRSRRDAGSGTNG
jgi:transcriptional regulator with XRE-family HTH domain